MPTYKITPDKLPILFRERAAVRYQNVVKAIQNTVESVGPGLAVEQTQRGTARLRPPINNSHYLQGWKAAKLDNGAVLFNDTPYAAVIEHGRRPGSKQPPLAPIAEWLEQKLRGKVKNRKKRLAQARSLAFVVARAIGRRGLPAHRVMARTRRKLNPLVQRAVREVLA